MPIIQPTRSVLLAAFLAAQLPAIEAILTDDATILRTQPAANFGASPQLQLATESTALLRFSLATLPAGVTESTVLKATLTVYVNRLTSPGHASFASTDPSWSEKTVSDATQPRLLGRLSPSIEINAANTYVSFDVTNIVRNAIVNQATAVSGKFDLSRLDASLDSKENAATSHPPTLDILLAVSQGPQGSPGPAGLPGPKGPKGDPGPSIVRGNLSTFSVQDFTVPSSGQGQYVLGCPASYPNLIGGGCGFAFIYDSIHALGNFNIFYSGPNPDASNSSWRCHVKNDTIVSQTVRLYVNCTR